MFCIYCGAQIPEDSVFCEKCGRRQPGPDEQEAAPAAEPAPVIEGAPTAEPVPGPEPAKAPRAEPEAAAAEAPAPQREPEQAPVREKEAPSISLFAGLAVGILAMLVCGGYGGYHVAWYSCGGWLSVIIAVLIYAAGVLAAIGALLWFDRQHRLANVPLSRWLARWLGTVLLTLVVAVVSASGAEWVYELVRGFVNRAHVDQVADVLHVVLALLLAAVQVVGAMAIYGIWGKKDQKADQ